MTNVVSTSQTNHNIKRVYFLGSFGSLFCFPPARVRFKRPVIWRDGKPIYRPFLGYNPYKRFIKSMLTADLRLGYRRLRKELRRQREQKAGVELVRHRPMSRAAEIRARFIPVQFK